MNPNTKEHYNALDKKGWEFSPVPTSKGLKTKGLGALLTLGALFSVFYLMNHVEWLTQNRLIGGLLTAAVGGVVLTSESGTYVKSIALGAFVGGVTAGLSGLSSFKMGDKTLITDEAQENVDKFTSLSGIGLGKLPTPVISEMQRIMYQAQPELPASDYSVPDVPHFNGTGTVTFA